MNYQSVAVALVLGRWSVKYTLKRMMGLNKVKVSWGIFSQSCWISGFFLFIYSIFLPLSALLALCTVSPCSVVNGSPVWFGSGRRWALGFTDNILLPAHERESPSVFIAHFVVGSFSGAHDKFARLYPVNPWLRVLKDDDAVQTSQAIF